MDEMKSGLTFEQAKGMADRAIRDVKNGIVSAGYALKAIRSERLWVEQGFTSFDDFMEHCYQKDKSWASNCIRVYEKFGELAGPEQEPRLQAKYQEYSAGGLIEMLSMPEELREQVTADMPVREIRELKREARKVATSEPKEQPESQWPKTCITGWSKYGNCVCCGVGGVECCASCQELCNSRCGWIPEETEEEDSEGQQETAQRKISTEGLLEKYERELAEMQEVFQNIPKEQWPSIVEKTQILTAALRLLAEQERKQQEELEPLEKEQPELPKMKNNDQRKEWLRNYQDWGLWYEDDRIGVRYYKYEFDNGARLIAEEYPAAGKRDFTTYYLHLVGGPEPPKHPSYGCPRWSRHARYDKHPDSETELVEFLKAVQR